MDQSHIDWDLLDRLAAGTASLADRTALEALLKVDPQLRSLVLAMRAAGRSAGSKEQTWDVWEAWLRLHRRMEGAALQLDAPGARSRRAARTAFSRRGLLAAAAVVVFVAASVAIVLRSRQGGAAVREVVTRPSQTAIFELPDGSRITLAPASRLGLPADLGMPRVGSARDVSLEGEAYLEIKHDSRRPFRVHTAGAIVEDAGTEFVVTAYRETHGVRVAVAAGQVALYREPPVQRAAGGATPVLEQPRLALEQGDLALLASTGVATLTHHADLQPYMAWTQGNLAFDGTRLGDVVPQLERWYDVRIRLADSSLADRRLTATFRRESLAQVLELLTLSLDLRVEHQGSAVLLVSAHARLPAR
jgi:ferric-dicitrate binding protein FerR (iron transport regulator)